MRSRRFWTPVLLALCLAAWLARPASAAADRKFVVSISGGLGYLMSDEWFRDMRAQDLKLAAGVLGVPITQLSVVHDEYRFERILPEFYAEAAYRLTPRLSLGLAAGYVSRKWTLAGRFERRTFIPEDTAKFNFAHEDRFAYFPVQLFAAYDALRMRASTFGVRAALSFDILKLDHVARRDETYFSRVDGQYKQYRETVTHDGAGVDSWGLKVGVFGERRLTDALATFIAVEFRVSPLGEVRGSSERRAVLKSNDRLVYDKRETLPRASVQPGHAFVMTGPVVRGGLRVAF